MPGDQVDDEIDIVLAILFDPSLNNGKRTFRVELEDVFLLVLGDVERIERRVENVPVHLTKRLLRGEKLRLLVDESESSPILFSSANAFAACSSVSSMFSAFAISSSSSADFAVFAFSISSFEMFIFKYLPIIFLFAILSNRLTLVYTVNLPFLRKIT